MNYIIARLGEASTWRGLVWAATSLGLQISPDQATAIITAGTAIVALISIFTRDKKGDTIVTNAPVTITTPTTINTEPKG